MLRRIACLIASLAGLAALSALAACGDDGAEADIREVCSASTRLAIEGAVGPTTFERFQRANAYVGTAGEQFFGLVLEGGESPHRIVFNTRGQTQGENFRDALRTRIDSGATDAGTFEVVTRPDSLPCDPAEGVICASYGVDSNSDGQLVGANEIIYPVASGGGRGSMNVTTVTGNTLAGSFAIEFGAQTSGEPEGGAEGGSIAGCFVLNLSASLDRVE